MNKIVKIYDQLSKSEKLIADYFLNNKNEIISMNIYELSDKIGTSSASVSRFVKKVFGKSFSQTKIEIAKNLEDDSAQHALVIFNWADKFDQIPDKIIANINRVFRDVVDLNSIELFQKTVDWLNEAENIYLFGVGSSGLVAQDLQQKLIKLGKRALFITDSNFSVLNSMLATEKDVVIAVSNSGESKEVNIAVRKARENGAKIVSITKRRNNRLGKISDIVLVNPSTELNQTRLAPIFSRYEQLFIVDILFVGLSYNMKQSPDQLYIGYQELLKKLKENNK